MKKLLILFICLILTSCVYYGSGIRTVSGTLSGTVPVNVKIGVFADTVTFLYDNFTPGDPDKIYQDHLGNFFGSGSSVTYSPVVLGTLDTATTYTIILPQDPSTIRSLIAWDDVVNDNIFDVDTETAYLPVKTINSTEYVVNFFTSIDAYLITYIVNYSDLTYTNDYTDNFDAIGADGFDFTFD